MSTCRQISNTTYKVHLDGYNFLPYLTGQEIAEQRAPGTLRVWAEPFTELRLPLIFNLRTDPYERAEITSNTYYDWMLDHAFMLVPAQAIVGQFLETFKEYPPSQTPASFSLDQVMKKLQEGAGSK